MDSNTKAINATLNGYRDALVASDTAAVMKLYTDDAVVMAQNFSTQVGRDAVEKWYNLVFELITLNVKFDIKEVSVVSEEYAFARTSSAGTQKDNKSGATEDEANQELFVLRKTGGDWKLARYCFNTTNPPKA